MRIVCARYGLRGVRVGEASHPGPPKLVLRGVSQQSTVSDPIAPTLLDALEEDLQMTRVPDDVGVLKFDLTQADSVSSSSSESAVPLRRRRHGIRFSVFSEESEDEGVVTEVDPSSTNPRLPVAGYDRPERSSPASLEDTESIRSGVSSASSEADDLADDEPNTLLPISGSLTSQARGSGLVSLDEVILEDVFSVRARLMATVPKFLRGTYRAAVRVALDGVLAGWEQNDTMLQTRSWKLFLLIPRMFLFRSSRGGLLPRKTIEARVSMFMRGSGRSSSN